MVLEKFDILPLGPCGANGSAINPAGFNPNEKFSVKAVIAGTHGLVVDIVPFHLRTVTVF
jgi:hypothetical protein